MNKEQRMTDLKGEIQRIAWSKSREDRDRCLLLKRQLARMCLGPASSWDDAKCEWCDFDTDLQLTFHVEAELRGRYGIHSSGLSH